ncbi:hypothetical protein ACJBUD_11010, partial [Streptococcus suis]
LQQVIIKFALVLTGLVAENDFLTPAVPVVFFNAKWILEAIFGNYKLAVDYVSTSEIAAMHPRRTA